MFVGNAKRIFKDTNVTLYDGDSAKMIELIGRRNLAPGPYVFWLDAHSTNESFEAKNKTLFRELTAIQKFFKKEDIRAILIDDTSGFTLCPSIITLEQCWKLLMKINSKYRISFTSIGGAKNGPGPYDVDVLAAYDPDLFETTIKLRENK